MNIQKTRGYLSSLRSNLNHLDLITNRFEIDKKKIDEYIAINKEELNKIFQSLTKDDLENFEIAHPSDYEFLCSLGFKKSKPLISKPKKQELKTSVEDKKIEEPKDE